MWWSWEGNLPLKNIDHTDLKQETARSPELRDIAEIGKTKTLPLMNADRKKIIAKLAGEGACGPQFIPNKKRGRLFLRPLNASRDYKSNKPFYWQTDEDPPTRESQNLAMGAPPAEPVAGIVTVCSVKIPLVTVAPFGTMSEG